MRRNVVLRAVFACCCASAFLALFTSTRPSEYLRVESTYRIEAGATLPSNRTTTGSNATNEGHDTLPHILNHAVKGKQFHLHAGNTPPVQANNKRWRGKPAPEQDGWSTILKTPYLNCSSFTNRNIHFNEVAKSMARPYANVSSQVCSLVRATRFPKGGRPPNVTRVYQDPVEGLVYVKVPKAASSTLAGVNERIAMRWGHRLHEVNHSSPTSPDTTCTSLKGHIIGAGAYYANRQKEKSFLWGSVRDPASRAISRLFFFQISQAGNTPDDETILHFLAKSYNPQSGMISKGKGGFQLQYLTLDQMEEWYAWGYNYPTVVQRPDIMEERVKNVTLAYDFIAVTERMDESVVAMQLLLGIKVGDILSVSAKIGGGFYAQHHKRKLRCIALQKAVRSPAVNEYLSSDTWFAVNYGDYLLYAAANQSLDMTIESIGREAFDDALRVYRHAQETVDTHCTSKAQFPCSPNGTLQTELAKADCYDSDEGCGFRCIDELAVQHDW